jgi:hypothetical protein
MSKLALDATIQRDIAEDTRNSVFAQSETALQLAWVAGGALGLVEMPGVLGFVLAAAAVAATLVVDTRALRNARTGRASSSTGRGSTRAQGPTATGYTEYAGYAEYAGYNRPLSAAYEVPPTRPDPTAAPADADLGANTGPDPDMDMDSNRDPDAT